MFIRPLSRSLRKYLVPQRPFTSASFYDDLYEKTKLKYKSKKLPKDVNLRGVFACNELDLGEVELDSFLQIQLGTVYRGLTPLSDAEVLRIYKNRILSIAYVEGNSKLTDSRPKMMQLADLFSVPEMCLLCNNSIRVSHGLMHGIVMKNVHEYVEQNKELITFFERLTAAGKKLFLVTNSPFQFVNTGMKALIGSEWKDFFDVVIVQARKPRFFTETTRPFRLLDEKTGTHLWDRVSRLEKGRVYYEGTVKQLQELKGWNGHQVLYSGDHPYSDLADVTLEHGWRTGPS
uniref:5'-nucleotidase domain-containing protein 3 n=1 Tax=Lutzomyia longipalpis TaxID=7200 RepID=A0A1B0CEL9_LUTLO